MKITIENYAFTYYSFIAYYIKPIWLWMDRNLKVLKVVPIELLALNHFNFSLNIFKLSIGPWTYFHLFFKLYKSRKLKNHIYNAHSKNQKKLQDKTFEPISVTFFAKFNKTKTQCTTLYLHICSLNR